MSKKSVGLLIKSQMVLKKRTQEDLAKELGISKPNLNAKLNGKRSFTVDELTKIGEILDIPFRDFF